MLFFPPTTIAGAAIAFGGSAAGVGAGVGDAIVNYKNSTAARQECVKFQKQLWALEDEASTFNAEVANFAQAQKLTTDGASWEITQLLLGKGAEVSAAGGVLATAIIARQVGQEALVATRTVVKTAALPAAKLAGRILGVVGFAISVGDLVYSCIHSNPTANSIRKLADAMMKMTDEIREMRDLTELVSYYESRLEDQGSMFF